MSKKKTLCSRENGFTENICKTSVTKYSTGTKLIALLTYLHSVYTVQASTSKAFVTGFLFVCFLCMKFSCHLLTINFIA